MSSEQLFRQRCVLLARREHRLFEDALRICQTHFRDVLIIGLPAEDIDDSELASMEWDLLVSFLSNKIIKGPALQRPNFNLHPGPPEYPGRGGATFALYDGATSYGATAHVMNETVDSGQILAVSQFAVQPLDTCETLFARAELDCVSLLSECLGSFSLTGHLPSGRGEWRGPAKRRKELDEWLVLNPEDRLTFLRKARAALHSKLPGPYVFVHGLRFGLVHDPDTLTRICKFLEQSR